MGDERPTTAKPVTGTVPEAAGRDQEPIRSAPDETSGKAEVGDGDDGQTEIAVRSGENSARLGVGATAATGSEDRATGHTEKVPAAEFEHIEEAGRVVTLDEIEGHVLRAIRYHEARARFLDLCRRWLDFSVVLLGAGAITTATGGENTTLGVVVGVLLAGIGALQLVAGFSERANDHTSLKRRFCGVLAEIMEARGEPPSERRLAKITKKWAAIWSDEPPTLHVLEAIAWNAARRAREYELDESTLIEIPRWHSWTRNLSSWESFEPLTRAERAARAAKGSPELKWWQRPKV